MRILIQTLLMLLISTLVGCHSTYGNVVPQTGPTMEQVYDSVDEQIPTNSSMPVQAKNNGGSLNTNSTLDPSENNLTEVRKETYAQNTMNSTHQSANRNNGSLVSTKNGFKKLPNPELTLFVFPHLAGDAEIPIPGYSTAFNAYDHDHYALPQDTMRQ